jgi:hypothetical protein
MRTTLMLTAAAFLLLSGTYFVRSMARTDATTSGTMVPAARGMKTGTPYVGYTELEGKNVHLVVNAEQDSWVRIIPHVSIDTDFIASGGIDPDVAAAWEDWCEISDPNLLSAVPLGSDLDGDGTLDFSVPANRVSAALGNAVVQTNAGYSAVQMKWHYVTEAPSQGSSLSAHSWSYDPTHWNNLESHTPPVRTAKLLWSSQLAINPVDPSYPANETFSQTGLAEAALSLQLGESVFRDFAIYEHPNLPTSLFSALRQVGAARITFQAIVIKNPGQSPWNGVGIPAWQPAQGWENEWVSISNSSTFTLSPPFPNGGGLPLTTIAPGAVVEFDLDGYATPMTMTIKIGTVTHSGLAVSYVTRRRGSFVVPNGSSSGQITLMSIANPFHTWIPDPQGIATGSWVQSY